MTDAENLYEEYQRVMSGVDPEVKTAFDERYMQEPSDPADIQNELERVAQGDYSGLGLESKASDPNEDGEMAGPTNGSSSERETRDEDSQYLKQVAAVAAIGAGVYLGLPYLL